MAGEHNTTTVLRGRHFCMKHAALMGDLAHPWWP